MPKRTKHRKVQKGRMRGKQQEEIELQMENTVYKL